MKYSYLLLLFLMWGAVLAADARAQAQDGWWDWALPSIEAEEAPRRSRGPVEVIMGDRQEEGTISRREGAPRGRTGEARSQRGRPEEATRRETWGWNGGDPAPRRHDGGYEERRQGGRYKGGGPPFCQNGEGHPVHGRQWCIDKGFGLGGDYRPSWKRASWEDVIFRAPRRRSPGTFLDRGALVGILGSRVYGQLDRQRRALGVREPVVGRWAAVQQGGRSTRVLQLRAGRVPLAELTDWNGDGRVDVVLLNDRR